MMLTFSQQKVTDTPQCGCDTDIYMLQHLQLELLCAVKLWGTVGDDVDIFTAKGSQTHLSVGVIQTSTCYNTLRVEFLW